MKTQHFHDFDAFSEAVRDVDCVMMLQNPERRRWTISQVNLPEIDVQLGRLGSGNIIEGQSWADGYLLYLPLTGTCGYSVNGTVLDKHSFMVLEPGCEFCLSTKFKHDWCSIFVPADKFFRDGDLEEPLSGSEKMTCRVARTNRQLVSQFRTVVGQTMTAATSCSQFESAPAATSAAAELLNVASLILGQRPAGELDHQGRPPVPRKAIIRRSKQLLEEREDEPLHLGELTAAAEVSERTLRRAFQEYFGVGPIRYLQLRQHHQVYRTLRKTDPEEAAVGDVLVQHGVWEFSRFASRYRKLFGELPSATLKAKAL